MSGCDCPKCVAHGEAVAQAESQGFHEGTRASSAEILALQDHVEQLREERDAWRGLCEAGPQHVNVAIGALVSFYRDDERRDITAWLKHQGDQLAKQGEAEAEAYLMAAYQVAEGARMIGPGASRLSAAARRHLIADRRRKDGGA
jgi:hypothetical protein